ncbi:tetraspanin [Magnaporthiopsis poae ATCC 64411]|uniref:Tetraspanin n=1 Tax=Magnaporthiopsis poae (strain ATCC 64411 / 73-15) TaxID=644358 RepID=A0A0C4DQX4_MAGP6|nr:tetraspanin [Magnaporthiopsis poae ATCC 64411]
MANKILLSYVAADFLFVLMGAFMLGFSVVVQNVRDETPTEGEQAARNLLYQGFPLTAGIVNAIMIFVTFALTIPAVATPTRGWLKLSGYLVVVNALFTLCIGTFLWVTTLKTRDALSPVWSSQPAAVQALMEAKFKCCGYFNSTSPAFVTNSVCPSPAAAALMRGCAAPLTSFANTFVDNIFTAVYGMCGIDGLLVLATACLLKERKEQERFRHIDEKSGTL